jgi:macrolide transport system ATP-binding/permease protein
VANHAERIIEISDGEIIRDQPNPNARPKKTGVLPNSPRETKAPSLLQANWAALPKPSKWLWSPWSPIGCAPC